MVKTEKLTIRKAGIDDTKEIADIHVRGWQEAYVDQMPRSFLESLSVERKTQTWSDILSKPHVNSQTFVAERGGNIVGFCSIGPSREANSTKETGELYAIYVDPDAIGTGIGSQLHEAGLKHLQSIGCTRAILWVLDTNTKTIDWYEKHGWRRTEKVQIDDSEGFELKEVQYEIDL